MKKGTILLFALALHVTGCAPGSIGSGAGQTIPVEIRSTSYVTVSEARAVRQNGRILVSGSLRRSGEVHLSGHVDVLFVGPDDSPLGEHKIRVVGLTSGRGGVHIYPFRSAVQAEFPSGVRAVLSYHAPPF